MGETVLKKDFNFDNDLGVDGKGDEIDLEHLQRKLNIIMESVSEGFINGELIHKLNNIDSPSPLSSISENELRILENDEEEGEEEEENGELNKEELRELFYELMIEKHSRYKAKGGKAVGKLGTSESDDSDLAVDISKILGNEERELPEEAEEVSATKEVIKCKPTIEGGPEGTKASDETIPPMEKAAIGRMVNISGEEPHSESDNDSEASDLTEYKAVLVDLFSNSHIKKFLEDEIEWPPEDIPDMNGCKSLKTVLQEEFAKQARECALHAVVCLIELDNRPLNDDELSFDVELAELVQSLNSKCDNERCEVITGCVISNDGIAIVCFELSLFSVIRLAISLSWSGFTQKVNNVKIFSNITFTNAKFQSFTKYKTFFIDDDERKFPNFTEEENPEDEEKRMENERKYLYEISEKLGHTFEEIGQQSYTMDPNSMDEFFYEGENNVPSKNLLLWALDCPLLKGWSELVHEVTQPQPFYDFTQHSYPFPTDTFNLRNLYFLDDYKDLLSSFYAKGFRPKFNSEDSQPDFIVSDQVRKESEKVFKKQNIVLQM